MSRNPSTTCTRQKSAGGPETVYLLPVATRTTVELEVVSTLDTVLAIRTACDDPLTEVACNDNPLPGSGGSGTGGFGGGGSAPGVGPAPTDPSTNPPPPVGDSRDARLRATLNPGTYYVIVDEAEPFGVGGPFTLKVKSSAPPAQASCSAAKTLTDGLKLASEELDVAFEKPTTSCAGADPRPALFYTARIPAGQRLTVRAQPMGGDRSWTPVMQLQSACTGGRCLTRDTTGQFGDKQLRYVNNGTVAEDVILAVSASNEVSGASFSLSVSIGDVVLNGTCGAARPITDGLVLRNQDLSEGQSPQGSSCGGAGGPSLFYSVTLLPQQRLTVVASFDGGSSPIDPTFPGKGFLFMSLRTSCSGLECRTGTMGTQLDYVNGGNATEKLVLEVSGFPGAVSQVFDLTVMMPLPPGAIIVSPVSGLVTSEGGGKASFEVMLGAPPASPVMIPIESGAPTEGTVSPSTLTFGPTDWDRPQKVTITGVDDNQRDGNRTYKILVKPAISSDARYKDLDADDVAVVNRDDEASFNFDGLMPLATSESGGIATLSVSLNKKPSADVTLPFSSSDTGEGTVSPASLTFTPQNWDTPQYLTVTGVDDKEQDGPQAFTIVTGAVTTTDPAYAGLDPDDLPAVNADNEFIFVPARAVNGGLPCFGSGSGRSIATDAAGNIYVAMSCSSNAGGVMGGSGGSTGSGGGATPTGGSSGSRAASPDAGAPPPPVNIPPDPGSGAALVAVSTDSGSSFGKPRAVGLKQPIGDPQIAGGPPGVAYLVGQVSAGTAFTRTRDGGATWSNPKVLSSFIGGPISLAAAGNRVVIVAQTDTGPEIWHSDDGGETFGEYDPGILGTPIGLRVQADGVVWLYVQQMLATLMKSTDGGASFDSVELGSDTFFESVVFGAQSFFGSSKDPRLVVAPMSNPVDLRFVDGLSLGVRAPRSVLVDGKDGVFVLDATLDGTLQGRRLEPGATSFSEPRKLGSVDFGVSGVALSEKALAVATWQGGQVMVSIQVWE